MQKIIVITGASSGVGLGLKNLYKKNGDFVISLDKNANASETDSYEVDVANEEEVMSTFEDIAKKYGHVDVLINCAGYAVYGATELIETIDAKKMFDVDYFGMLSCIKGALKYMSKGGKIFNIASACAFFAVPYRTHYSACKAAVNMLSFGLSMELKNAGIEVVSICPGDIRTNFSKNRVKTFTTNERYGDDIQNRAKQIDKRESKRMTLEYATAKMYKIFNKRHHKPMYIIGTSMKFAYFANKIFPIKFILKMTDKIL